MGTTGDGEQDRPDLESTRWVDVPRDTEAPFYRAPGRTPEETYAEIAGKLGELLVGITEGRPEDAVPTVERIRRWHRQIFATTFPGAAGKFRGHHEDRTSFGVWLSDDPDPANWKMTYARAVPHEEIVPLLEAAVARYQETVPPRWFTPPPSEVAAASAGLFTEVLRIHPFVDGNMRASVAVLHAAIHRLGRPTAGLLRVGDWEFAAAFSTALRPDERADSEPLTRLIAERISRGGGK